MDIRDSTILITGAVGFIGSNLILNLIRNKSNGVRTIVGIDNISDYYDVSIKEYRKMLIDEAAGKSGDINWLFIKGNIADNSLIERVFDVYEPNIVINLAAQAGVRYSITNPDAYIESNVIGFYNILEACRHSYDDGKPGI